MEATSNNVLRTELDRAIKNLYAQNNVSAKRERSGRSNRQASGAMK
jgi:hypothetical protein